MVIGYFWFWPRSLRSTFAIMTDLPQDRVQVLTQLIRSHASLGSPAAGLSAGHADSHMHTHAHTCAHTHAHPVLGTGRIGSGNVLSGGRSCPYHHCPSCSVGGQSDPALHTPSLCDPAGSEYDEEEVDYEESDSDESWTTESAISSEAILSSMCMNGGEEKPFACPVPGCKKRYKVKTKKSTTSLGTTAQKARVPPQLAAPSSSEAVMVRGAPPPHPVPC